MKHPQLLVQKLRVDNNIDILHNHIGIMLKHGAFWFNIGAS